MPPEPSADTPLILSMDTSAAHCAVAVLRGDDVVADLVEPMTRGQAERLFPMAEEALKQAGARWSDLTRLAVCTGPGNFTGVRISVAASRGLALSLGIPSVGISAAEALLAAADQPAMAVIPARRDTFYAQSADDPIAMYPGIEVAGLTDLPFIARTDQAESLPPEVRARLLPNLPTSLAPSIARLAAHADTATRPAPLYLRPADAALPSEPPPVILP